MDEELNDYGYPDWSPRPQELDRGRLNQINPSRNIRWSFRQKIDPGQLAEELAKRLENASHVLVDRLFGYLSNIPADEQNRHDESGLTLPASAIGWLSTQLYPRNNEGDSLLESQSEAAWMGASMRDRLALLKYLLPRATHLRITLDEWPPPLRKSTPSNLATDFTGRDLDLSNISVHSGVTMETSLNVTSTPSIQSFLLFYNQIQNKPRLDMKVFSNLCVLFLDGTPPEWVVNLRTLHNKIKLIRCERGCIFDMSRFLYGVDNGYDVIVGDHLSPNTLNLTRLTYLKVNYAALGELSGLRRRRRNPTSEGNDGDVANSQIFRPPPLSQLPNLISLSLAHNEIRTVKTALAGLASLSKLNRLDLSYNRISTMKGANHLVGNIKTLILTGNLLINVVGLEKLYSLETLHLDGNRIGDIADIAGLGKLPELMALYVRENPLVEKDPIKYRVSVLDLFKSTRFYSLLPGATYRQLLQLLPVLDGFPASKRELVGLKSLTFRPALTPLMTGPEEEDDAANQESQIDIAVTSQPAQVPESFLLSPIVRAKRVTRKSRRGQAVVSDGEIPETILPLKSLTQNRMAFPQIDFSTKDVVETLAQVSEGISSQKIKQGSVSLNRHNGPTNLSFFSLSINSVPHQLTGTDELLEQVPASIDAADTLDLEGENTNLLDNYSFASYVPPPEEDGELLAPESDQAEITLAVKDEDNHFEFALTPKISSKHIKSTSWFSTSNGTIDEDTPLRAMHSQAQNTIINPFDVESPPTSVSISRKMSFLPAGADFISRPCISFPEGLWDDTGSDANSIGTGRLSAEVVASETKWRAAENMSVYDGPDGYKKLSVMVNLELYFKLFVFPSADPDANNSLDLDEESVVEASPRIQLRPVDRAVAEEAFKNTIGSRKHLCLREIFNKVWQDEVIACGRSGARRLTPHKKLRRGFHGDPIFRDGSISFVAECRKIILCTSDVALYLIPDYDAVSILADESNPERKFPSPIPHEALFQNGPWPHALARLPIESLRRITIGFSFQRLILHFAPSSAMERSVLGNASTFIVATSNRIATVKLLQHLQDLTKVTDDLTPGQQALDVVIDNEDKQVLDALSVAVAPCPIDVVIHYQVLQQRWNRGDRGTVRRACVITDCHIFLLDEDYVGDGSESYDCGSRTLAEVRYNLIDSAELSDIVEIQAASVDPREITIIIRPLSSFQRNHHWRLLCRDSRGAERLVEDARKATASVIGLTEV